MNFGIAQTGRCCYWRWCWCSWPSRDAGPVVCTGQGLAPEFPYHGRLPAGPFGLPLEFRVRGRGGRRSVQGVFHCSAATRALREAIATIVVDRLVGL